LSSTTAIVRPDGTPYVNDYGCWVWLQDRAAKAARWLGYVPFDCIHDARNEDPIWSAADFVPTVDDLGEKSARTVVIGRGSLATGVPDLSGFLPHLTINGSPRPLQPYRLGLIGEKSSLRPVVEQFASIYDMDVVLDTGDASDSHLYEMAKRASNDPRPFVVFYLSDFDPGGHNMPTSVARKFQALRDLHFPELDLRIYPVALTLEQCIEYDLPSAPLKPSEKRKAKWQKQTGGREQTELDALMVLRPGALEKLLHAAIKPFYDPTLDQRFDSANATPNHVRDWFLTLPAYTAAVETIMPLRTAAVEAIDALNNAAEEHAAEVHKAVHEAKDAPKLEQVEIKPEITAIPPEPMFHTLEDFVTATRKLITRRDGSEGGAVNDDGERDEGDAA
jgi:hypothetical protein